jgi:hypothetical protein
MSKSNSKEEFKARVREWAVKLDTPYRAISVRPMKNKWASYSQKGSLTFNIELLTMNRKVSDYVIVHELLHVRVPNHGKLWRSLMRAHLGDYERSEKLLKENDT